MPVSLHYDGVRLMMFGPGGRGSILISLKGAQIIAKVLNVDLDVD
jgi:hypothetical protein